MTYAAVVDWYGPYDSVKAAKAAIRKWEFGEVLYMAAGTVGPESVPKLQYIGITTGFESRMNSKHEVRSTIKDEGLSIYVGEVASQAVAGRKGSTTTRALRSPCIWPSQRSRFFFSYH